MTGVIAASDACHQNLHVTRDTELRTDFHPAERVCAEATIGFVEGKPRDDSLGWKI
jgi:hypothetical protein